MQSKKTQDEIDRLFEQAFLKLVERRIDQDEGNRISARSFIQDLPVHVDEEDGWE
ncbi:hypothetical protein [Lacticaseibacillus manihotivorans]|uniref:hypothetical protein n=1 Tax=Lacticaseibacillus manihotivorans TaxID=88233 RepID=UPI000A8E9449|nr:hypothetical protein [Lacticaseibacillus manihotivorans]